MASDSARMEVVQCERDIQAIKTALRKVGAGDEAPNSLIVSWLGMDDTSTFPSAEGLELWLQLSSPMEEVVLTKVVGPESEEAVEGSSITFSGVESSMATLTVTLKKDGQILGTSESFDLAPLCSLEDAMNPKDEYVHKLPVAIVSPDGKSETTETTEKPAEEETEAKEVEEDAKTAEEGKDSTEDAEEKEKDAEESADKDTMETAESGEKKEGASLVKPLCSLTLKLVFKPSPKDVKEELFELLNKTSLRKSQAIDQLKKQQSAMTKASPGSSETKKQPAVKAGFLNKKPKKQAESKWKLFYEKYLGPDSLARGLVLPIAKNYIIFFGAVVLCHFKGQELALPAPV